VPCDELAGKAPPCAPGHPKNIRFPMAYRHS
jgi:hypothetical protein